MTADAPSGSGRPRSDRGLPDPSSQPVTGPILEELVGVEPATPTLEEVTLTGRVERLPVEGGPWVLTAEDGSTWQLVPERGDDPVAQATAIPSGRVRVTGVWDPRAQGSAQVGPLLWWRSLTGVEDSAEEERTCED